jgi:8-oxo-dGTP pyrophosphatase MutT (NUDIX family)
MARISYARRSGRVLLVDGEDRILLLGFRRHADSELGPGVDWLTPGGGVKRRESARRTAARELFEEVGLRVAASALGPMVATTSGYADLGWIKGVLRDDFFFFRIDSHVIDDRGLEDFERSQIVAYRWWSMSELSTTKDRVMPNGLSELLADLLAGRVPTKPVHLPWHH